MRSIRLLGLCALLGLATPALADHADHAEAQVPDTSEGIAAPGPYQAVVTIHGLVCSFCAMGARKGLARIEGLDRSQFTDGVFVDIENQRVTLAFVPGAAVRVSEIREAIRNAGYEAVELRIVLDGWESPE